MIAFARKKRGRRTMRKKAIGMGILFLCLAICLAGCGLWPNLPAEKNLPAAGEEKLTAYFLDVGQADASLFFLPGGATLLVDAGNRGDGDEVVSYLQKCGVKRLDYILATHPHADHIGGMAEVIKAFEVGKIFAPKIEAADIPTTRTYEEFLLAVGEKGKKLYSPEQGDKMAEGEDWSLTCLTKQNTETGNLNNYSIGVKLSYGIHSVVLTGDAEQNREVEMLRENSLSCTVYKVAHHGSSDSNSSLFLKALSPKVAVVSCGEDNSYGHPHREVLQWFSQHPKIALYRTDKDKTIKITLDGKTNEGMEITTDLPSVCE